MAMFTLSLGGTNFGPPKTWRGTILNAATVVAWLDGLIRASHEPGGLRRAAETVRVAPRDVILVEGILLFADARLRALFDVKVFVDVADDVRFIRRLQRDVVERGRSMESIIQQYLTTVRPMHLEFVEPSKRWADIILPEGGQNSIGIEMIIARVEREARRRAAG